MGEVVNFNKKSSITLREKVAAGYITEDIRNYLIEFKDKLESMDSKSWDRKFITNMISFTKKLTKKQIDQLDRILNYEMLIEEHPGGIEEILDSIVTFNPDKNKS